MVRKKYKRKMVSEEGMFKNDQLNGKGIKYYQGVKQKNWKDSLKMVNYMD